MFQAQRAETSVLILADGFEEISSPKRQILLKEWMKTGYGPVQRTWFSSDSTVQAIHIHYHFHWTETPSNGTRELRCGHGLGSPS